MNDRVNYAGKCLALSVYYLSINDMKKILVTEDDPGLQDIYRIILERAGYSVTMYSNGNDLLQNNFDLPDLFLLDKQLSGTDGLEICKFLKSQPVTQNIPVIIISATVGIQKLVNAVGADAFIEKPFEKKYLLQVLEEHLQKTSAV